MLPWKAIERASFFSRASVASLTASSGLSASFLIQPCSSLVSILEISTSAMIETAPAISPALP